MKITREARQTAKKLFKLSFSNGQLNEDRLREIVSEIGTEKPRNYLAILSWLLKLVEIEYTQQSVHVASAVELPDRGAAIFEAIEQRFGPALDKSYSIQPELLGGLRVQRGSDVWNDSIRSRLDNLLANLK